MVTRLFHGQEIAGSSPAPRNQFTLLAMLVREAYRCATRFYGRRVIERVATRSIYGTIAQLVERPSVKRKRVGSYPTGPSK